MSESPNKLIKLWQELKRRKVFGVVTTYAATAYIIIEVTNNLAIPLHLPDWFASLELIILVIGLPVAVIIAWIFDFTPQGIKKTESLEELEGKEIVIKPVKRKLRASYVLNAVLLIAVIVLAYPKIFKRDTLERLRSSGERITVAVMPFQNMTGDTTRNIWQDWIQDILISYLSSDPEELEVRQTESVNNLIQDKGLTNYASLTPSLAKAISRKLDANVFIHGNMKMAGSSIRLNAQLTDSKTGEILKPFQIEGFAKEENVFQIIDSLSEQIKNFLIISKLKKEVYIDPQRIASSASPEAYRYFTYGQKVFGLGDYPSAINLLTKAVAIDSNLTYAILHISYAYNNMGIYDEAKKWCLKAYKKRELMPVYQKIYTNMVYADLFETPYESIKYWKQLQEIDDHWPQLHFGLGFRYCSLNQYEKGISEYEKSLDMYDKMGIKPWRASNYFQLGVAYHKTGQYKKEKKLYKQADKYFPDEYRITARKAILALSEGDTIAANKYIEKFNFLARGRINPEKAMVNRLPNLYYEAGLIEKAEELYRQELLRQPDNPVVLNSFAYFLINNDGNIDEGLELVEKALALSPGYYEYLHTKGWGLYKQGKYKEALDLLQESWDIRMKNAIYDHTAYLHLEEAKKALAWQKNN